MNKAAGPDTRSLAAQLDLFQGLFANENISKAANERGGAKLTSELELKSKTLRTVSSTTQTTRGTPAETERMDLLDGLIVDMARSARKAARSAAEELGQEAIATTFELDKLYTAPSASRANAQVRAKQREKGELIVKILAARNLAVSKEHSAKILDSKEDVLFDKWLSMAGTVASAEALFA